MAREGCIVSSYFDAIGQRIAAVREGPRGDILQHPWKALSGEIISTLGDVEVTAAAVFDGIHVLATWKREVVRGDDGKPGLSAWTVSVYNDEAGERETVTDFHEGECVPPTPPYAFVNAPEELSKIEEDLVRDVTVCAMSPGFPEDLSVAIHKAVLRYGVTMLPTNAYPAADFETLYEHRSRLYILNGDLHSIFHEAAHRGFGDNPLNPVRRLYALGEEERERLVLAMQAWTCGDPACGRAWGLDVRPGEGCTCPRCGKPGFRHAGETFAQIRARLGYDMSCWECPNRCDGGCWASTVDFLSCPACGTPGIHAGFTLGDARESGLNYPVRT